MSRTAAPTAATFCFVDVAGFTALTEAHGDETAADLIQRFQALIAESVASPGRIVDAVGDAVLVVYPAPGPAISFVTRLFERANAEPDFPALRAGLHHGPVVERDGRFFGATLNLAARVAAQAQGGQILATAPVVAEVQSSCDEVIRLGSFTLRNIRDAVELFAVNCQSAANQDQTDPVCRMRVQKARAPGRLRHNDIDYWFCSLSCAAQFAEAPDKFVR